MTARSHLPIGQSASDAPTCSSSRASQASRAWCSSSRFVARARRSRTQLARMDYAAELRAHGAAPIHELAVASDGKQVRVRARQPARRSL